MTAKQDRSTLFKTFQLQIKNKDTFEEGKSNLLELRRNLKEIIDYIFITYSKDIFNKMPLKSDKTIGYYLYHLTRIEDITSNTLIQNKEQIFFRNSYMESLNTKIITTGNELNKDDLIYFSGELDINNLKLYIDDVYINTNLLIKNMSYLESKTKILSDLIKKLNCGRNKKN